MNKKTTVTFVYLALFAFTLGLSFTLATTAQCDSRCLCCDLMCPDSELIKLSGHFVPGGGCTATYDPNCGAECFHMKYPCP